MTGLAILVRKSHFLDARMQAEEGVPCNALLLKSQLLDVVPPTEFEDRMKSVVALKSVKAKHTRAGMSIYKPDVRSLQTCMARAIT